MIKSPSSKNIIDQYAKLIDARRVPDSVYQAEKSRALMQTAITDYEVAFNKMMVDLSKNWNEQEIADAFYAGQLKNSFTK